MKTRREEIKRTLLAEVEAMLDELLEWEEEASEPTLLEIEEVVLKLRQRVAQRVAETLINEQETHRPVPGSICPTCHREMRYKWSGAVRVGSRLGPLQVRRGYFYCERCRRGIFPLDEQLGLRERHWSEGVIKEVVWLSGLLPYEQVAEVLKRIGHLSISDSASWRLVQKWGDDPYSGGRLERGEGGEYL